MTPRKQSTSPLLSYLLMGGILSFGAGAAYMVLSDSDKQAASAQKPPAVVAPAPVRQVASAQPALKPSAQAVRQTLPVTTPAPVAAAASIPEAAAAVPAAAVAAQVAAAAVPVAATPAAVASQSTAPAPVAQPVTAPATAPVAVVAAPKAPVKVEKLEPVVPASEVVAAFRVAVPSSTTRVSPAIATNTANTAPAAAATKTAPTVTAQPAAKPAKPKRAEPAKPVVKSAPVAVKASVTPKTPAASVPQIPVARAPALPQEIPLPMMKNLPKLDAPVADRPAVSEEIVESRPESKPAAKASESAKPVVKPLHAAPLVPSASKPTVVMANGDKAWVKLDEQRTVIITKGQEVPGLGTFHGADKNSAKFDSGTVPVNQ